MMIRLPKRVHDDPVGMSENTPVGEVCSLVMETVQTHLTLPVITPPLPDVGGLSLKGAGLVVVRPLAHHVDVRRAVEYDERENCQVDLMDLIEDLLPHAWIYCRLFLPVESIQSMVAVESKVDSLGWELVARQHRGIVGVIAKVVLNLGDVKSACHCSRGRGRLPPVQERAKEYIMGIVLDVELDANRSQVALKDPFANHAPWMPLCIRGVLELQTLPTPGPHPIRAFHPAVVLQQFVGRGRIKDRAGGGQAGSLDGWPSHGRCTVA